MGHDGAGGGGRVPDDADVEDHVPAVALEAVNEQPPAVGAAPDRAVHGVLAQEQERRRLGRVDDGDVVDVDVALAAPGQGGICCQYTFARAERARKRTHLYRTPICRMTRSSWSLVRDTRELR